MPFTKRPIKFRKNIRNFGSKTTNMRREMRNVKKRISKIARKGELKWWPTQYTLVTFSAGAEDSRPLNIMAVGDTVNDREGNSVYCTSVQFRLTISATAFVTDADLVGTAGYNPSLVRAIVVWDKQANGASPTSADVLDLSGGVDPILAPYNMKTQKRFKVMYDMTKRVDFNMGYAQDKHIYYGFNLKKKISLAGRETKYNAGTSAITSITTGSVHLILMTNSPETYTADGMARLIFKE